MPFTFAEFKVWLGARPQQLQGLDINFVNNILLPTWEKDWLGMLTKCRGSSESNKIVQQWIDELGGIKTRDIVLLRWKDLQEMVDFVKELSEDRINQVYFLEREKADNFIANQQAISSLNNEIDQDISSVHKEFMC